MLHFRHETVGSSGLGHKPSHPTLVLTQAHLLSPDVLPTHQVTAIRCQSGTSNSSHHDLNSQTPSPQLPFPRFHDWHHPVALTQARSLADITDLGFLLLAPIP